MTIRPYSANTYALSKVWFKCSALNLRVQDINFINSQVKSWLYQDCFEKPSELVLYRQAEHGGLGLFNVKIRALALLIRAFLETAIHPNFRHSLFHQVLFRFHVLGEVSLPDPGFTPYYDQEFFRIISHYHNNCPLNVAVMSTKQWYQVLLEDQVLMSPEDENSPPTLLPVRVETLYPTADWSRTWSLARTKGLGSELTSFIFKLLHRLLPTQDRVSRLGGSGSQGLCQLCHKEIEDQLHAFFMCQHSLVAGHALLGYLQSAVPGLSPEASLRLELDNSLSEKEELATICMLSTGLKFIWETRLLKKQVSTFQMRAELEAKISILRKSRHRDSAELMDGMLT